MFLDLLIVSMAICFTIHTPSYFVTDNVLGNFETFPLVSI